MFLFNDAEAYELDSTQHTDHMQTSTTSQWTRITSYDGTDMQVIIIMLYTRWTHGHLALSHNDIYTYTNIRVCTRYQCAPWSVRKLNLEGSRFIFCMYEIVVNKQHNQGIHDYYEWWYEVTVSSMYTFPYAHKHVHIHIYIYIYPTTTGGRHVSWIIDLGADYR